MPPKKQVSSASSAARAESPEAGAGAGAGAASSEHAPRPSSGPGAIPEPVPYTLPVVKRRGFLAQAKYTYELWTGLYMLEWWEKALFSESSFGIMGSQQLTLLLASPPLLQQTSRSTVSSRLLTLLGCRSHHPCCRLLDSVLRVEDGVKVLVTMPSRLRSCCTRVR